MSQYFYEDQVYTIDKKGNIKFGLVVENEVGFHEIFHPLESGIINFHGKCQNPYIIDKTMTLT
jgi:hypothetical protein